MKPVNLNQLLLHPKGPCLSFFLPPSGKVESELQWETFFQDMADQLTIQERPELVKLLVRSRSAVRKIVNGHPDKAHGFFFSEALQGYTRLEESVEPFCMFGTRFHVRPLLEEIFVNPEFVLVNVSLYDVSVYKVDFRHVEILRHFEFENFEGSSRSFAPQFRGVIPYKSVRSVRTVARKVMELTLYDSLPVVVTGLEDMKKLFLRNFEDESGVISHFEEDFFEKTCVEILERCKVMRPAIMDFYSARLKARLSRVLKSKKIVTDLEQVVKSVAEGKVVQLVLPVERKLWGTIDLETGTVELHKKPQRKSSSVDILSELAEEVMRQGGRIEFLGPHFFPEESQILAVLKGAS